MDEAAKSGWWKPPRWLGAASRWADNIAKRLVKQETPDKLLEMREHALAFSIRKFGPDSRASANARGSVAQQLECMGRMSEARLLWETALTSLRQHLGDDDEQTAAVESWLASNLMRSGLCDEAKPHYAHLYEIQARILGSDHELTQRTGRTLASLETEGDSES